MYQRNFEKRFVPKIEEKPKRWIPKRKQSWAIKIDSKRNFRKIIKPFKQFEVKQLEPSCFKNKKRNQGTRDTKLLDQILDTISNPRVLEGTKSI